MTQQAERMHLQISGSSARELGLSRGELLRDTLPEAYASYAGLFRANGVDEDAEREAATTTLDAVEAWNPRSAEELHGIAEGSGLDVLNIAALNARTEILALGSRASKECTTVAIRGNGTVRTVQTWDWHTELDPFWHTHEVAGPGYRFAGLTEQGIVSKIGINEAGLALHFNILGHAEDGPGGVPMHVLSAAVLGTCATVDEAIALVTEAPIRSSSSFTLADEHRSLSLELTPVGVFEIPERDGYVVRTNHFQHETPLARQRTELYEPDSTDRLKLVHERLAGDLPEDTDLLVQLLESGVGDPPLSCVPDMALQFGERWETLATVVTDPMARTIRVLDGMPTEARTEPWRELRV